MSNIMSPGASPGVTAKHAGVRRVNNLPLFIVVGIMLTFLLIMMVVAMNRSDQQNAANDDEVTDVGSTNLLAAMITGDFKDGIIESKTPPASVPDMPAELLIARPDNLDLPPMPPGGQTYQEINPDAEHIRMMKMQQFEEAVKAGTNVTMLAPRSTGSSPTNINSTGTPSRDEMLAKLAAVRQQINANKPAKTPQLLIMQNYNRSGTGIGGDGGLDDDSAPQLMDEHSIQPTASFTQFNGEGDRWKLDSKPERSSPYSLLPGFVIPAVMISGINSELPGQITAQVSQDIYDTPIGQHRLIPQGARLVGEYSNDVAYGQRRVLVAWQRIIFPDGKTMDIGAMHCGDALGQSGFNDQVNNHYTRVISIQSYSCLPWSLVRPTVSATEAERLGGKTPVASCGVRFHSVNSWDKATTRLMERRISILHQPLRFVQASDSILLSPKTWCFLNRIKPLINTDKEPTHETRQKINR